MAKVPDLTSEIKEFGIRTGAETIGVAPVERFAPAPVGFHPEDLLPGARSVVAFTVRQLAGYCESAPSVAYQQFGYIFKNLRIDRIAWEIARFIDDKGYWALPYCREGQTTTQIEGGNPNPFIEGRYKEKGQKIKITLRGDISMRKAAEAAGLGRIGVNGLLLTPEYGPRTRIGLCMTTAELEPSPLITDDFCGSCNECVKACPGGAITENGPPEFDPVKCAMAVMRRPDSYENAVRTWVNRARLNTWDDEIRLRNDARFVVYHRFVGTGLCGTLCVNACPVGNRRME